MSSDELERAILKVEDDRTEEALNQVMKEIENSQFDMESRLEELEDKMDDLEEELESVREEARSPY